MISLLPSLPNLIIVTEHFSPSCGATAQLISDLVDHLARDFNITVLTATPSGSVDLTSPRVIRLCTSFTSTSNVRGKALAGLSFLMRATGWLLLHSRGNTPLLIISNPPFIGIIGLLLRLFKSSRYLFVLQDVFPRSAILTGVLPAKGPITYLWTKFMSLVLSSSSKVVVLNSQMVKRCINDFSLPAAKLTFIDNWAVEHASTLEKTNNPVARLWKTDSVFTVQYSGNFGRLHDMLTILEASRLLQSENVKFTFIGDGAKRCQISTYIKFYQLENVSLHPYQSRADLPFSLGACDVSIISMIPGSEDTVAPSKFYGIIASGKPVLLIGSQNSALSELITKHECGAVVSNGDPIALARVIADLSSNPDKLRTYGRNALNLYNQNFGACVSSRQYLKAIASI